MHSLPQHKTRSEQNFWGMCLIFAYIGPLPIQQELLMASSNSGAKGHFKQVSKIRFLCSRKGWYTADHLK